MIVPLPTRIVRRGKGFTFDCGTTVRVTPGAEPAARLLRALLRPATGLALPIADHGQVVIALDARLVGLGAEGYALTVNEHGLLLRAGTAAGLAHGVQTIRQLLPVEALKSSRVSDVDWTVPGVDIRDVPRLPWRGFMLDVARHFQPVHVLRRVVDLMALHKLNVLHLHLTDDQGWRLPIPSHPLLTSVGGWRAETNGDGVPHGGAYTRGELESLVAHAAARGIRVMPEIEMPGHARAALAAYPDLGVAPEPLPVWTRWGISDSAFGLHALGFVREVLAEVLEVFPGQYVHLGGDECLLPEDVHGRFLRQAGKYLLDRGRTPAAWEPTGDPRAVVMPWKDESQAAAALERGQPVVMAPHTSTYLDYPQSDGAHEPPGQPGHVVTSRDVYHVPLPDGVLGAQCQLWTEHARTREHLEYLAFPRLVALADTLWSQRPEWKGFTTRMRHHASRLAALSIPAEVRREPCEHS
ncbi:beta-N-acetylhexosaminidase [Lentzea flava]|uniref:beta-N-acetylhexosaminidase n=1 Tax=Lentzea flava TaxID=103732 RepID=A0ABQ2UD10_9PSEU|nr:beta-N-acetylhexosaminidase [Lentzea flava]MCP2196374.1 hexosaminidase [Lentzea flava]GGU18314.1 beta-hexosaminidase [Lentzea flava]